MDDPFFKESDLVIEQLLPEPSDRRGLFRRIASLAVGLGVFGAVTSACDPDSPIVSDG